MVGPRRWTSLSRPSLGICLRSRKRYECMIEGTEERITSFERTFKVASETMWFSSNNEMKLQLVSDIDAIEHRLRLNEYILYVFGQTRRPLAVSRAKICPGSRPEVPSTPKSQKRRYEVSRSTRADSSQLTESDYLWCLLETFSM